MIDDVTNSGVVDLAFSAEARGQSISVVQSGFALSEASAESTVDALGQGGDDGEDTLINSGRLHIEAGALTTARAIGGGQFGYTVAAANSIARAASSGMAGGSEDDTLINEASGVVDVSASARVNATSASVVVGGATEAEARTQSFVEATGLSGGAGADTILNAGSVTVGPEAADAWMSFLNTQALSVSFAGATEAQSAASASTRAIGIDGGAEGDGIRNEGDIAVKANARSSIVAGTLNIFGSGSSGGESGAMTHATGITGGDGDDGVESLGALSVWAESNLYRSGAAYTFGGSSETGGTLAALTNADGIAGGAGVDRIGNGGELTVDAHSVMFSEGDAETTFGAASESITSGAVTRAFGLSGGDADDILENRVGAACRSTRRRTSPPNRRPTTSSAAARLPAPSSRVMSARPASPAMPAMTSWSIAATSRSRPTPASLPPVVRACPSRLPGPRILPARPTWSRRRRDSKARTATIASEPTAHSR